ncbi:MAG: alpha/beta hydrolase [Nitrospira sp.]|nr:alpha/beta hydrolase [Nitrospira sp.]
MDYAKQCALIGEAPFVEAGAIGHINAESDLGAWPPVFVFLTQLLATRDPAILHNECRSTDAGNPQRPASLL